MMKKLMFVVALAFVSLVSTAQSLKANMDLSGKPGDDFWQYAVGTWLKDNPLDNPPVASFIGSFEDRIEQLNAYMVEERLA